MIEIFRLAKERKMEELLSLHNRTKQKLLKNNIFQWGDWGNGYPNKEFIKTSLDKNELFILTFPDRIIGSVVLNQKQSIEWNKIPCKISRGD
ncbi:MAG: hypothetical protein KGD63_10325 [Candidatus Lokiarchaeota archaeon]|nr:hypothetical protein [Candidatus Lokiarchaeota archaeon]